MTYKVWDGNKIRIGTALEILQEIVSKETNNEDISSMNVKQYARALIQNAPYYLPQEVFDEVIRLPYQTEYDKALSLLNVMPASQTRIVTFEPDQEG